MAVACSPVNQSNNNTHQNLLADRIIESPVDRPSGPRPQYSVGHVDNHLRVLFDENGQTRIVGIADWPAEALGRVMEEGMKVMKATLDRLA